MLGILGIDPKVSDIKCLSRDLAFGLLGNPLTESISGVYMHTIHHNL